MATELPWGSSLVRLFQTLTDNLSGLAARRNLGVFCLTAPDQVLGETVTLDDGSQATGYTVSGQDRLYLLQRQIGSSWVVGPDHSVLQAVAEAFAAAGLSGVQIDTTASAATTPGFMVWPLVATDDTSSTATGSVTLADGTTTDGSGPTTWLTVINDLLALVAYRGVWCDENGIYRCGPYTDPGMRPSQFTFDADADDSTVGVSRTRTQDLWKAPNTWVFIQSNLPDGVVPADGAGIYYPPPNATDGPASESARNGLKWASVVSFTAADQASLVAQGDAQIAKDKRAGLTLQITTAPYPCAGHFDVFTYRDQAIPGGQVKVQATSWQIPLNGDPVSWTLEQVG
jgi:hypothetical protein